MTLSDLSERTGIAASNLSRLERGRVDARASTLSTVLAGLGLTLAASPRVASDLDGVKARMEEGARRLADAGRGERDVASRLAWKERRGLDTTVERRVLASS